MSLDNVEAAIEQGASIKLAQLEAAVRSIHKAAQKLPDECLLNRQPNGQWKSSNPRQKGLPMWKFLKVLLDMYGIVCYSIRTIRNDCLTPMGGVRCFTLLISTGGIYARYN
jgi:hypothetical protein